MITLIEPIHRQNAEQMLVSRQTPNNIVIKMNNVIILKEQDSISIHIFMRKGDLVSCYPVHYAFARNAHSLKAKNTGFIKCPCHIYKY